MGNWYHCSIQALSRSNGRSAVAAAAYRSGDRLDDAQGARRCDYSRKQGVAESFIVTPDGAPDHLQDRQQLWNAAEQAECRKDGQPRKNATTAREMTLALPAEASDQQRAAIARDMAGHLAGRYGVAVDVAVHRPGKQGDPRNHHAHLMFTTRQVDAGKASGLGAKTRSLDDRKTGPQEVEDIRATATQLINREMERTPQASREDYVDHRSYQRRGIEAVPSVHEGPNVRHAWRKAQARGADWQPRRQAPAARAKQPDKRAKQQRMDAYRQTSRADHNAAIRAQRRQLEAARAGPAPAPRPKARGQARAIDVGAALHPAAKAQAVAEAARAQQPAQQSGKHEPERQQDKPTGRSPSDARTAFERARHPTPEAHRDDLLAKRERLAEQRREAMNTLKTKQQDEQTQLSQRQKNRDSERLERLHTQRAASAARIERENKPEPGGLRGWWRKVRGRTGPSPALRQARTDLAATDREIQQIHDRQKQEQRDLNRRHDDQRRDTARPYDRQAQEIERELDRLKQRHPQLEIPGREHEQHHHGGGRTRERGTRSPST